MSPLAKARAAKAANGSDGSIFRTCFDKALDNRDRIPAAPPTPCLARDQHLPHLPRLRQVKMGW